MGNFFNWKDYGDPDTNALQNTYTGAANLGNMLADPRSPFYEQYRSYLSKLSPTMGTNSWLAPMLAGGGNYANSQVQANIQQKNFQGQRNDFLNKGVQGFASQNLSMLPSLYNVMNDSASTILNAKVQREQIESQEGGFLDSLGTIAGTIGGIALAPMTGGFSMALPMAMQAGRRR